MIKAKVTHIIPGRPGRDAKVFARSRDLVSAENRNGEAMFYAAPPYWTGGRQPHVGQQVLIGSIESKTSPHWPHPKLLAREVSSAYAIAHYSPRRAAEPTRFATGGKRSSWIARFLSVLGLPAATTATKA